MIILSIHPPNTADAIPNTSATNALKADAIRPITRLFDIALTLRFSISRPITSVPNIWPPPGLIIFSAKLTSYSAGSMQSPQIKIVSKYITAAQIRINAAIFLLIIFSAYLWLDSQFNFQLLSPLSDLFKKVNILSRIFTLPDSRITDFVENICNHISCKNKYSAYKCNPHQKRCITVKCSRCSSSSNTGI